MTNETTDLRERVRQAIYDFQAHAAALSEQEEKHAR
jgi:hypothetical protein